MNRYEIFDAVQIYYANGIGQVSQFKDSENKKKVAELEDLGYTHNHYVTEATGGDNDYIVIDHQNKEFCFWENGFSPFCFDDSEELNSKENLSYWSDNRK